MDIDFPEILAYPDYTFCIQGALQDRRLKLVAPKRIRAGRHRVPNTFSTDQFHLPIAPEAPPQQPVPVTVSGQELAAVCPFFP
jgi:hypothetical protein